MDKDDAPHLSMVPNGSFLNPVADLVLKSGRAIRQLVKIEFQWLDFLACDSRAGP